jgi:hypothetical protein
MRQVQRRGIRTRWLGVGMLGLLLSGCAGALADPDDLRVTTTDEGLYLFTRSSAVARSVCIASGLDAARAEGRLFAEGRPQAMSAFSSGSGIQGCQMQPRSLIICQEGDAGCLAGSEPQAGSNSQARNK